MAHSREDKAWNYLEFCPNPREHKQRRRLDCTRAQDNLVRGGVAKYEDSSSSLAGDFNYYSRAAMLSCRGLEFDRSLFFSVDLSESILVLV